MGIRDDLLTVATAYAAAIKRSEATVSRRLFTDASRLSRLREGKDMLSGNVEVALQTLSDLWPEGTPWPESVPRPARSPAAAE